MPTSASWLATSLALVPLREPVAARTHGVAPVVVTVGVLGDDAHHGKGVEQRVAGLVEVYLNRRVVRSLGRAHHREVGLGVGRGHDGVDGKGDVGGAQGLAVGEARVIAGSERPGETVVGDLVGGGEVIDEVHVLVGDDERRLDERLVHVLAAAPVDAGVEAGGRLVAGAHGHDDLALWVYGGGSARGFACACGRAAGRKGSEGGRAAERTGGPHERPTRHVPVPHTLPLARVSRDTHASHDARSSWRPRDTRPVASLTRAASYGICKSWPLVSE